MPKSKWEILIPSHILPTVTPMNRGCERRHVYPRPENRRTLQAFWKTVDESLQTCEVRPRRPRPNLTGNSRTISVSILDRHITGATFRSDAGHSALDR